MQSQQTLIASESLELGAELGQGEFGSVLKGVWTDPKGGKVTCLLLLLCIRSAHLKIAGFPMGGAY